MLPGVEPDGDDADGLGDLLGRLTILGRQLADEFLLDENWSVFQEPVPSRLQRSWQLKGRLAARRQAEC